VRFSRSVGFAELAHLGRQRAVVDDAFLAQEVFQLALFIGSAAPADGHCARPGGPLHGPYRYKSERINGRVVTRYGGRPD
jgi:hypothetical protein